jgi:adenylate cyclase class 2
MNIEYEATFTNVNKDQTREKLLEAGASLIRKEFLQKRVVFNLPKSNQINGGWLRVRDEGDKITMSLKVVDGDQIHNQKETQLTVDSFEEARKFLTGIGCEEKAFQESRRELWRIDGVDITIDEWPFLEPFVEVEGKSEEAVKAVSEKIGFDYNQAEFCSVDTLYNEKYNVSIDQINNHTPKILFEMENPFTAQ